MHGQQNIKIWVIDQLDAKLHCVIRLFPDLQILGPSEKKYSK